MSSYTQPMSSYTQQVSFDSSQFSSFDYQQALQPRTVSNSPGPFTLSLNLIEGRRLNGSNVYCKIRIGCQTFKSGVMHHTTSPMWNTTYSSTIYSQSDPVSVRVFTKKTFRNVKLGEITIDVPKYTLGDSVKRWYPFAGGEMHIGITISKFQ